MPFRVSLRVSLGFHLGLIYGFFRVHLGFHVGFVIRSSYQDFLRFLWVSPRVFANRRGSVKQKKRKNQRGSKDRKQRSRGAGSKATKTHA